MTQAQTTRDQAMNKGFEAMYGVNADVEKLYHLVMFVLEGTDEMVDYEVYEDGKVPRTCLPGIEGYQMGWAKAHSPMAARHASLMFMFASDVKEAVRFRRASASSLAWLRKLAGRHHGLSRGLRARS